MKVRDAEEADLPWMIHQLGIFWNTLPFSAGVEYDAENAKSGLPKLMATGMLILAESDDGVLSGMLGAWKLNHPFAPQVTTYSEAFWWVAPERRGCGAGAALLAEYVLRAEREGVRWVSVSLEAASRVKESSLERFGFQLMERTYLKGA